MRGNISLFQETHHDKVRERPYAPCPICGEQPTAEWYDIGGCHEDQFVMGCENCGETVQCGTEEDPAFSRDNNWPFTMINGVPTWRVKPTPPKWEDESPIFVEVEGGYQKTGIRTNLRGDTFNHRTQYRIEKGRYVKSD